MKYKEPWKAVDMRQDPMLDGVAINARDSFDILDGELNLIAKVNPKFQKFAPLIAAAPVLTRSLEIIIDEAQREADSIGQSRRCGDQSKKDTFLFIVKEAQLALAKARGEK